MPRATLTYALAWAKSGGCEGQITIIETACDRCQGEGSNTHRDARRLAWWHPVGLVPSSIRQQLLQRRILPVSGRVKQNLGQPRLPPALHHKEPLCTSAGRTRVCENFA